MKVLVFAVYDNKIGTYAQPFFSQTISAAKRSFVDAASDPSTLLSKHPEDFSLFHLGEFDDSTGFLDPLTAPENLGLAASYLKGN